MAELEFISKVHRATPRNYLERVVEHDKAACAEVAVQWGQEYWDGDRKHGYGGFSYDGRWRPVAEAIIEHYKLSSDAKILDVGCGKAFLLYEFFRLLPQAEVCGVDISQYALMNAKPEVQPSLVRGSAVSLPFADDSFDLVYSINTLHNLYNPELELALKELNRVSRGGMYLTVEAYRNEQEKVNLMYWQLTCRQVCTPDEWKWWFRKANYTGDYGFIYFE